MQTHQIKVPVSIARRLMLLRGVAIGYPLDNGKWSLSDDHPGFREWEEIQLIIASPSGRRIHLETKALVVPCHDGRRAFKAVW